MVKMVYLIFWSVVLTILHSTHYAYSCGRRFSVCGYVLYYGPFTEEIVNELQIP